MLYDILKMDTKALFDYLKTLLDRDYQLSTVDDGENYIFYESLDNPICLVAHIDTVRPKGKLKLEQAKRIIRNKKGVLGADDRAGVYGVIELLRRCKKQGISYPSVLFTNHEEIGGVGVKVFIDDFIKTLPFQNTHLFIEMDRCNANQYVYYSEYLPDEVKTYVESFGFVESYGSYSDIADLTDIFSIPSVNLSIGYYEQHTKNERLHLDEMNLTISRVFAMLKKPIKEFYPIEDMGLFEDEIETELPSSRLENVFFDWDDPMAFDDGERPYHQKSDHHYQRLR